MIWWWRQLRGVAAGEFHCPILKMLQNQTAGGREGLSPPIKQYVLCQRRRKHMTRAQMLFAFFSQLHQIGRCPKWINEVRLGRDRSRKTGRVKEPVRKPSSIIIEWQSGYEKESVRMSWNVQADAGYIYVVIPSINWELCPVVRRADHSVIYRDWWNSLVVDNPRHIWVKGVASLRMTSVLVKLDCRSLC